MATNRTFSIEPVRFEDGKSMQIAGLKQRLSPAGRAQIPQLWARFAPHLGSVPGQVGTTAYGVIWPVQASDDFDYMAGVEVQARAAPPPELTVAEIPANRYAVFTHPDHVSRISETMFAIHTRWLPGSGHEPARGPAFERYGEGFDPKSGRGDIELWLPVRA